MKDPCSLVPLSTVEQILNAKGLKAVADTERVGCTYSRPKTRVGVEADAYFSITEYDLPTRDQRKQEIRAICPTCEVKTRDITVDGYDEAIATQWRTGPRGAGRVADIHGLRHGLLFIASVAAMQDGSSGLAQAKQIAGILAEH